MSLPKPRTYLEAKLYAEFRHGIATRDHFNCVRCGLGVGLAHGECHHRLRRAHGGPDSAFNCIWLCGPCHEHIHKNPAQSYRLGFLVPSWADFRQWPVCTYPDRWRQKSHDGWKQPTPDGWVPSQPDDRQVAS